MPVLTVEKPLRDSLGNDAAIDSLIRLLNESREEQKKDIIEFVEEKFERRLSEEIGGLEVRLSEKIVSGDSNLSERISRLEGSLDAKINASKAEIIKWMFIFWVGQVGMILGILFAFFK
ncbi:hypothetical protein H8E88_04775 [candidate division KSB1 bacterium]|nr:hypothetical protein [candidate division KSB1 bacterium]